MNTVFQECSTPALDVLTIIFIISSNICIYFALHALFSSCYLIRYFVGISDTFSVAGKIVKIIVKN